MPDRPREDKLEGVVVVVTGADTPAGAAYARSVAAAGARALVLCGDDGGALGTVAHELGDIGCRTAIFLGADAGDTGDLTEMVHELFVAREQQETADRARGAGR